jgi:hypothetical protein
MKIGMSGHQDIPNEALAFIRREIAGAVSELVDELIGVSSLAAGADQLFASLVLEHGGRLHIIVPSDEYETTLSDPHDVDQFRSLLGRAETVEKLSYLEPSEEAFLAAGRRVVEESDLLLAVWDGQPAKGKGGTADIVEYARNRGRTVKIIWPRGMKR